MLHFFVGGAPKSGTTWMQMAIDAHPDAVCSGEGHFHGLVVKPMLDLFAAYNAKLDYVGRVVYGGRPVHAPLTRPEIVATIRRTIVEVMARRAGPDTRALGDKTPSYAFVVRDLDAIFPAMRFVLMVRDPRDVAASRLHQIRRTVSADALEPGSETYRQAVSASADNWATAHARCRAFGRAAPGRLLVVRYEDLLDAPELELRRVFAFLDLDPGAAAEAAARTSFEALSGRKPGVEDRGSFFRKGVKGDWPNVLDPWALDAIAAACGPGMGEMGYGR